MSTQFICNILFLAITASCNKTVMNNVIMPPNNSNDTGVKTYLALGDSYTIGQSVQPNERFPAQTLALLKAESIMIGEPQYVAVTGWTTLNLLDALAVANLKGPFGAVSLLIGVNDQYQFGDTANYRQRFTQLLAKSIELAGGKTSNVFVLSIPDYSVTPFAAGSDTAEIRKELDDFNNINKEVTLAYSVSYTYITDLTRKAGTDPTLVAVDGLHPSGKEYLEWAKLLAPKMAQVIK